MKRFDNKVAIVTGAAAGIGAATARRFAEEGAELVLSDIRDDVLRPVAAELERGGAKVLCQRTDVGDCEDVQRLIDTAAARCGRIDVLVNNAGITSFGHVTEITPEQWRKVMAVDLDSIFFASRTAIPHLARTRGCIVNTASISGLFGDYGLAAYNAAKGGVVNLTRTLAIDHARDGYPGQRGLPRSGRNPADRRDGARY
jgi:meso-butanediol dehydrogenase/(S,S)-butanediol dehydrogenase/diacetyl reductase